MDAMTFRLTDPLIRAAFLAWKADGSRLYARNAARIGWGC
jgi:hypothetical protein